MTVEIPPLHLDERWTTVETYGDDWHICTLHPTILKRLERFMAERPGEVVELYADQPPGPNDGQTFSVPRQWVRIRPPRSQRGKPIPAPPVKRGGRETDIVWSDAETTATVYTTDATWVRKLCRWGFRPKEPGGGFGWEFVIPKAAVKLEMPRQISEAQATAGAERLRRHREGMENIVPA